MGDGSRTVVFICGPCEYITPFGVQVPHNPLIILIGGIFAASRRYIRETHSANLISALSGAVIRQDLEFKNSFRWKVSLFIQISYNSADISDVRLRRWISR